MNYERKRQLLDAILDWVPHDVLVRVTAERSKRSTRNESTDAELLDRERHISVNYERKRQLSARLAAAKVGLDETLAKEPIARAGVYASFLYEVIGVLSELIADNSGGAPVRLRCESRCPLDDPSLDSQCVGSEGHLGAHVDEWGRQWQ